MYFNGRIPTVKTMMSRGLARSREEAKAIREALEDNEPHPIKMLEAADRAMNEHSGGSFGVEDLYPDYPHIYHVNTGDTYNVTLVYNSKTGSITVTSWGDAIGV